MIKRLLALLLVSSSLAMAENRLAVYPEQTLLIGTEASQQIAVTFEQDGQHPIDVTRKVTARIEPADIAIIDAQGHIRPTKDGKATLHLSHENGLTASMPIEVQRVGEVPQIEADRDESDQGDRRSRRWALESMMSGSERCQGKAQRGG